MRKLLALMAVFLSACTLIPTGPNNVTSLEKVIADGVVPKENIVLFQRTLWVPPGAAEGVLGALAITDNTIYFVTWDEPAQRYRRTWTTERSKIIDVSIDRIGPLVKTATIYTADGYHAVYSLPEDGSVFPDNASTEQLRAILTGKN